MPAACKIGQVKVFIGSTAKQFEAKKHSFFFQHVQYENRIYSDLYITKYANDQGMWAIRRWQMETEHFVANIMTYTYILHEYIIF